MEKVPVPEADLVFWCELAGVEVFENDDEEILTGPAAFDGEEKSPFAGGRVRTNRSQVAQDDNLSLPCEEAKHVAAVRRPDRLEEVAYHAAQNGLCLESPYHDQESTDRF